ncbi:hypothetical protein [Variovorax sp. DT-64]|uniref:hypothetical protein n=1 Tax=Variovorax sp. DT-64 TaxID=3396160 RepID=UPI003F1D9D3C
MSELRSTAAFKHAICSPELRLRVESGVERLLSGIRIEWLVMADWSLQQFSCHSPSRGCFVKVRSMMPVRSSPWEESRTALNLQAPSGRSARTNR